MLSVDLIIPHYNRPDSVIRLLESVFSQNLEGVDLHVILSDDASSSFPNPLSAVCEKYQVQVVRSIKNQGPAAARNAGVKAGRSPYLCFIDSDDLYKGDYFQALKTCILTRDPDIGWSGTVEMINDKFVKSYAAPWKLSNDSVFSYEQVIKGVYVGIGCGFFIRRSFFEQVQGFNEALRHAEDTEFFIRLSRLNPYYAVLEEPFVVIRKGGADRVTINYQEKAKAYEVIIQNNLSYLQQHNKLLQQYRYKLAWSYLHCGEKSKGRRLLLQNLRMCIHNKSLQMLLLSFFNSASITKFHVAASRLKKRFFSRS